MRIQNRKFFAAKSLGEGFPSNWPEIERWILFQAAWGKH